MRLLRKTPEGQIIKGGGEVVGVLTCDRETEGAAAVVVVLHPLPIVQLCHVNQLCWRNCRLFHSLQLSRQQKRQRIVLDE